MIVETETLSPIGDLSNTSANVRFSGNTIISIMCSFEISIPSVAVIFTYSEVIVFG